MKGVSGDVRDGPKGRPLACRIEPRTEPSDAYGHLRERFGRWRESGKVISWESH